jgi:hypothetical protein
MTTVEFCYWLQGHFELSQTKGRDGLSGDQVTTIRNHLDLVFKHDIDPSYSKDPKVQAAMQATHDGAPLDLFPPGFTPGPDGIGGTGPDGIVYRC